MIFMYDLTLIKTNKDEAIALAKKLGFSSIYFIDRSDLLKTVSNRNTNLNIIIGGSDELNRKAVSSKNTDVLLDPEPNVKDYINQINSGLNQVLCGLAYKNRVCIAFSMDRLNDSNMISKIMQNIRLCRKYKVKMLVFTLANTRYELRAAHDLLALLKVLGMTPKEAIYALDGINEIMKEKTI